jgi:hypothetical protein
MKDGGINMTKVEWLEKNGFSADGFTYSVFGDDTYAIKDELKNLGCKYSPLLKWHSPQLLDLEVGYGMVCFSFDELMEWNEEEGNAFYFENVKIIIDKRFKEAIGPNNTEYYNAEAGERIRDLTVKYKATRGFMGKFGYTYIHSFVRDNYIFIWFTQKELKLEKGAAIELTGTIKEFNEYNEEKQTILTRCVIKEIEIK